MDHVALAQLLFPQVTQTPPSPGGTVSPPGPAQRGGCHPYGPQPHRLCPPGQLVQGIISERMAHQSGGVLFLRVEDTDAKREVPGAVEVLIEALAHYGITFDEGASLTGDRGAYGPYRQRQRAEIYMSMPKTW